MRKMENLNTWNLGTVKELLRQHIDKMHYSMDVIEEEEKNLLRLEEEYEYTVEDIDSIIKDLNWLIEELEEVKNLHKN
jgi:hypothetical protein